MAIDDLLDRARDARRRRDEAAGELAALVKALDGLDGVRLLDATQRRELAAAARAAAGQARGSAAWPDAASRAARQERERGMRRAAGDGQTDEWAVLAGGRGRRAVALAGRAGAARASRSARGGCWRGRSARSPPRRSWRGRSRGLLVSPARQGALMRLLRACRRSAPVPARVDRRRPSAGAARAAADRPGRRGRPRCACRRGARSRTSRRAASSWRRRSGCASCASLRDPGDASRGTVTFVRRDPLAGRHASPWPHADAERLSLWEPVPVGVDELGDTVSDRAARAQRAAGRRARRRQVAPRCRCSSPPRRSTRRAGCGCWTASWSSCRRGRRARERLAGPDVDEAIALLRDGARGDGGALPRAARARSAQDRAASDGLALHLVVCDELAFYLGAEDRKQRTRVRRAAARPGRPRPRGRRDRVRGDAEAGVRRRPVGAAGSVRVPARAALQHAAGVGHDPRPGLGDAPATAPRRSRPGSAASATCSPRTACPVRMRGFHLPDEQIARDRRARERAARRRLARRRCAGARRR